MDKLSIKIKISDREYPMRVNPEDEENIRKAGKIVNERLKKYHEQFGIDDKQDLLAMVAFDGMVEKLKAESQVQSTDQTIVNQIEDLNQLVSQVI